MSLKVVYQISREYAGGIMSAAVDGIKIAEMVAINNGRGKNEQ